METKLYDISEIPVLRKKEIIWTAAAIGALVLSTAVCAVICAFAGKAHDPRLLPIVIAIATVGGWTAITFWRFLALGFRHARKHTEAMLDPKTEPEIVEGKFELTRERLFIIGGVAMVKVKVSGNDLVRSLQIYDRKKKLLRPTATRVKAVHGFITEFE